MMLNRYQQMFKKNKNRKISIIPFITADYPTTSECIELIKTYINAGADALEIGLPFSDPASDGLAVQTANSRALYNGSNFNSAIELIAKIRIEFPDLPIGIMTYANIAFATGLNTFYSSIKKAGVDSCLIPDVPIDMSKDFVAASENHNIEQIFLIPHSVTEHTLERITQKSKGFNYITSRNGVTGKNQEKLNSLRSVIKDIKRYSPYPSIIGFGISSVNDIARVKSEGGDGVIIGSALINIIEDNYPNRKEYNRKIKIYLSTLSKESFY